MGERFYYITRWTDEVIPCAPKLEAWAKWLIAGDDDIAQPGTFGERFDCSVSEVVADVRCTRDTDGTWMADGAPLDYDWAAVRYGPGAGWSHENVAGSLDEALETLFDDEQEALVTCMKDHGSIIVELQRGEDGEPALVEVAAAHA